MITSKAFLGTSCALNKKKFLYQKFLTDRLNLSNAPLKLVLTHKLSLIFTGT